MFLSIFSGLFGGPMALVYLAFFAWVASEK